MLAAARNPDGLCARRRKTGPRLSPPPLPFPPLPSPGPVYLSNFWAEGAGKLPGRPAQERGRGEGPAVPRETEPRDLGPRRQ